MRIATVTLAIVLFAGVAAAQLYPGCKTDHQCRVTGDTGGYCRPNGYCHCDAPLFNNTWGGLCQLIRCRADTDCMQGGDRTGKCMDGACSCSAPYKAAPTPAFCNIVSCTDQDANWCTQDGDSQAYCKDNGACHCSAGYIPYPTEAYCTLPPTEK